IVVTALSLPGATIMTLAGGAIFGLLWGALIVSFASTIGATLAFLVSRFLLRDWVQARFGDKLQAVDEGVKKDGALYLFSLRLVPLFPFFVINLVMALTPMKARTFYWVSQIGMLAGTLVYVNAGTQLAQIESLKGILSPGLLVSFALLGLFPLFAKNVMEWVKVRKVYKKWRKPSTYDRNLVVIGGGSAGLVTSCEDLTNGHAEVRIPFDQVLVAVGRAANTTGFGMEELDILLTDTRTIETNDYLQTIYPNIYACGDVAGPYQFTHTAAHQAWYSAVNALFDPFKKFRVDYSVIPWATFVDPEVARVGLNELEAKQQDIAYEVTTYGIDDLDRAIADEEAHGMIKVLTVPGKDKILGVTIVGDHAGDLLAEYVMAMRHGIGLNKILGTIHIYPTLAEANKYVAGNWKRAHAPERLLQWVERFHAWRRANNGKTATGSDLPTPQEVR
ncbi:MAG: VTT domain-containing protein, partial [Pseudomonadota bacterium]